MPEDLLMEVIKKSLKELEGTGEIVVCATTVDRSAKHIYNAVSALIPSDVLSSAELSGLRSLVFHAINDKRFFDWEMPILTGFTADEFNRISEKLPKG